VKLEIDHIDGNKENNDPNNLCFMCGKCNCTMKYKSPIQHKRIVDSYRIQREKERDSGSASAATRFTKEVLDYNSGSIEMQANGLFEIRFIDWLWGKLESCQEVTKQEAINGGAYVTGANKQTTAKYLDPLTSEEGPLCEDKNQFGQVVIRFKPNLGTRRKNIRGTKPDVR
jgi:hypothetical protein